MAASDPLEEFKNVVDKSNYGHQAVFFLNAYWAEHGADKVTFPKSSFALKDGKEYDDAELLWKWVKELEKIDTKKDQGNSVDMMGAFRFLQALGEQRPAIQVKKEIMAHDIDKDNRMSLLEYLLMKFESSPEVNLQVMMKRPQGSNAALEKAIKSLEEEMAKMNKRDLKIENLTKKAENMSLKEVKRGIAAAELAVVLDEDLLGMRTAIVKAKAAVKRAKKSTEKIGMGKVWWAERLIAEAQSYKPKGNLKSTKKGIFE